MLFGLITDTETPEDTIVLRVSDGSPVEVPDPALVFTAEFFRDGPDLLLLNADAADVRILNYFAQGTPGGLVTPGGATLAPHVVERLAGPEAPGQYAQTGTAFAGNPIGQVEILEGAARVQRADGTVEELRVGMKVFQNDVVITEAGGSCSITFVDGTIFTLASGSRMILDELIFDPAAVEGNSGAFSLVEGSFVFIAGQVAKTGGIDVTTPAATMGIRGTTVKVDIQTVQGVTTVEFSLNVDPDGGIGMIELRDLDGNLIAIIDGTDTKWIIRPPGEGEPIEVGREADDLASDQELLADAAAAFAEALRRVEGGETFVELDNGTPEAEGSADGNPFETGAGSELDDGAGPAPGSDPGGGPAAGAPPAGPGNAAPASDPDPSGSPAGDLPEAPGNTAPTADDAALDATEDTRLAGQLSGRDADGDPLTFGLATGAAHGAVVVLADGSFVYTPDPDYAGPDSFTFSVSDGNGGTATGTVALAVAAVNDAPEAADDTGTTDEDSALDGNLLDNDSDAEDDPLSVTEIAVTVEGEVGQETTTHAPGEVIELASGALLTVNADGSYSLDPNGAYDHLGPEESATETFAYTVSDGNGGTDTATATITIDGVNDAPEMADRVIEAELGDATVTATLTATDVEDDALTFSLPGGTGTATTARGSVTVGTDGSLTYTPDNPLSPGTDSFEVQVSEVPVGDGQGGTTTATVTVAYGGEDFTTESGQSVGLSIDPAPKGGNPAGTVAVSVGAVEATTIRIVFAMDSSGSIGSDNWDDAKDNVAAALDALARQFDGSETAVEVALVNFASDTTVVAVQTLSWNGETSSVSSDVYGLDYKAGGTRWDLAFAAAEAQFASGTPADQNFFFFITDGEPTAPYQDELDSLNGNVNGLTIEAFAIGENVNMTNLNAVDSGTADVVETADDLTEALTATPLFNADLVSFTLEHAPGNAVYTIIADETHPAIAGENFDVNLPLAEIDGIADILGEVNDFRATAVFDLDGDSDTTDDRITLVSAGRIAKGDSARVLEGTEGADLLLGSDAADTIDGGGGNDVILGFGGDDRITLSGPTGASETIDGGTGRDVLALDFAGLIDLSGATLDGIEAIDMANGEANTLSLDADFVQALSDTPDTTLETLLDAALGDSLTVYGEAGDTLDLDAPGGGWRLSEQPRARPGCGRQRVGDLSDAGCQRRGSCHAGRGRRRSGCGSRLIRA